MVNFSADKIRLPKVTRGRAAALGFGLGATLALSPMVWAENPTPSSPAPQTMTSPVALIQQQSFAPLVKKVLAGRREHLGHAKGRGRPDVRRRAAISEVAISWLPQFSV